MKCPKCQFENAEGIKFCGECGNKLDIPAETSPEELSSDEKIAKIQKYLPKGLTEKILSQKDRIEGEHKQVTVMFCDMEGFTPLVEALGAEAVYSVMDQIYEILIHQVHDFDGTVNEMTGDGVMALFGAPIALEDAPQRALRSALSIHNEIEKFNEKKKVTAPIKIRIGVHTGPVVVGTLGNDLRVEFKAVGDTVNLASRMEGLADPGSTCVTADTFKLTKELFRFEAMGKKEVKGKNETVSVYKLLSAKKDINRPRLGIERSIYSEMVGRDMELDRLELQVMKVINGEGSVINIIGEAGIGKSRLVAELKSRELMKRVTLLEGRAISNGRNLSFHPIIDLLKQWAQIGVDEGEATVLNKLETAVRSVYPQGADEMTPFVGILMGMKLSGRYAERVKDIEGEALEKLILKNVRDLLIKATDLTPLVLLAEDMHWADTSSIELMESLFHLAKEHRILFINVFRPGYEETGDRIVEIIKEKHIAYYVEIVLEPLNERMSEALINNMLNIKGPQHAAINQIVKRADGNPFFIEEVVRSFIDDGAVVLKDGAFKVTDKINTTVIPYTINEVLMVRIDRLEEKTRALVKVASVIGRSFFYRILKEVVKTIEDIDSKLSYLKGIQLIRERRRMGELEYLFKHALAQEAAYESILLQKRKELHKKVAESIESVFKEKLNELYGTLAYHYIKAEDEDRAEVYLIKAGKEAMNSSASSEALTYFKQALNLYIRKHGNAVDPAKVAMLEEKIALALYNKGQYIESMQYMNKTLAYRGFGEPQNVLNIGLSMLLGFLSLLVGLYLPFLKWGKAPSEQDQKVLNLMQLKLEMYSHTNPIRFFFTLLSQCRLLTKLDLTKVRHGIAFFTAVAVVFAWSGVSFRLSKKIMEIVRKKIDKHDIRAFLFYGFAEMVMSFIATGVTLDRQYYDIKLLEDNLRRGEFFVVPSYLVFLVWIETERGSFSVAENYHKKLVELSETYESNWAQSGKSESAIRLYLKSKSLYEVLSEAKTGIKIMEKMGYYPLLVYMYGIKAQAQILTCDTDGAEESLLLAEQYKKRSSIPPPLFLSAFILGRFILDLFRLEEALQSRKVSEIARNSKAARKSGKKAIRIAKKLAADRPQIYRCMGTYYWLINQQKKAMKWWRRSIQQGSQMKARVELARTYFEVGKRLGERNGKYRALNGISVEENLKMAKQMFVEMDLQWDLDELERIEAYNKV